MRPLLSIALFLIGSACSAQSKELRIARNFAEGFKPSKDGVVRLVSVPDSVISAFARLEVTDPLGCEQLLALIFLKVHRSHLSCCNQSYELRVSPNCPKGIDKVSDPLLYQFYGISHHFKEGVRIEFIPSSIAPVWVKAHPQLKKLDSIRSEMEQIDQMNRRISSGEPWRD